MCILVVSEIAKSIALRECDAVPRIGELVDVFYEPLPAVTEVIWWPSKSRLEKMGVRESIPVAIVMVS